MTIDQAIAALESNERDALNGRIDFAAFKARRTALEAVYAAALSAACVRRAKEYAAALSA